jgi:hypothetical protein
MEVKTILYSGKRPIAYSGVWGALNVVQDEWRTGLLVSGRIFAGEWGNAASPVRKNATKPLAHSLSAGSMVRRSRLQILSVGQI